MIPKSITTGGNPDRLVVSLLKVHARGIDAGQIRQLDKTGADIRDPFWADVKPVQGMSQIHLVSLGSGEWYGTNSNGDWFNEKARKFDFPGGRLIKSAQLDGGLEVYHSTFTKTAAMYHNHKNSKRNGRPLGKIMRERYNGAMHRGELIVGLPEDEWSVQIQKIATGQPVFFSMGCSVPYDWCSWCGNKAKTRKNYCECMRYNPTGLMKTGHQVFAINDKPTFHDMSDVPKPADLIAFGLRKVAGDLQGDYEDLEGMWVPAHMVARSGSRNDQDRLQLLSKMAKLEKELLTEAVPCEVMASEEEDDMVKQLSGIPLGALFRLLSRFECMLPPKVFLRIVTGRRPEEIEGLNDVEGCLGNLYGDLAEDEDVSDILQDGSFSPGGDITAASQATRVKDLAPALSLQEGPVRKRILIAVIRGGEPTRGGEKLGTAQEKVAKYLARQYAKYQLGFLAANPPARTDELCRRLIVRNRMCSALGRR